VGCTLDIALGIVGKPIGFSDAGLPKFLDLMCERYLILSNMSH